MTREGDGPLEWIKPYLEVRQGEVALDLGAGSGETALWMADQGLRVEAVERDEAEVLDLERLAQGQPQLQIIEMPLEELLVEPQRYRLIVALAVLHFLRPRDLWPLADRLQRGLQPGGLLAAEVFTVDDPGWAWYRQQEIPEVEPNTFSLEGGSGWIHYFEPGELRRVFGQLEAVVYEETRRRDPRAEPPYRAGARFLGIREGERW